MDELTQQNAALVEEASASSKSMEEQAQGLLEQVDFFTVDEELEPEPEPKPRRRVRKPVSQPVKTAISRRRPTRKATESDQEWQEF
jgi:methyl-accepting chemotaxis protein